TATVSFKDPESGLEHQAEIMPDAPPPEEILMDAAARAAFSAKMPVHMRRYWETPSPIELRPVSFQRYFSRDRLEPRNRIWFRAAGKVPDAAITQAAILAYAS